MINIFNMEVESMVLKRNLKKINRVLVAFIAALMCMTVFAAIPAVAVKGEAYDIWNAEII